MEGPALLTNVQPIKELITQVLNMCTDLDTLDLVYKILITGIE